MPRRKRQPTELTQKQKDYIEKYVPPMHKDQMARALQGASMATAIKMMCRQCNAFENAATRTRECTITTCPLWPYRR